jgi:hypothetical protein
MAKAAQMHGTPRSARSLEDYESPEAYAGQGDDRIIRHRAFAFTVAIAEDNAGNPVLDGDTAYHGETVTLDQIGLVNLEKGERHHAFYTTEERRRLEAGGNPDRPDSVSSGGTTFSELGEWEMAEYINGENPQGKKLTVQETASPSSRTTTRPTSRTSRATSKLRSPARIRQTSCRPTCRASRSRSQSTS